VAEAVYILCALASLLCAGLLFRAWARAGGGPSARLLFWSAVCFVGLALNSVLVVADLLIFKEEDLRLLRLVAAACGLGALLWALICEPRT
jgi:hypothetical protein